MPTRKNHKEPTTGDKPSDSAPRTDSQSENEQLHSETETQITPSSSPRKKAKKAKEAKEAEEKAAKAVSAFRR